MEDLYSLKNPNIYLTPALAQPTCICSTYKQLIIEYVDIVFKQQDKLLLKNEEVFKFILIRGIDTLSHVFQTMLLYTQNIDATYYHCQRAIILYVEFITQICETSNNFLKLRSQDAMVYVFKKTIYNLNRSHVNTSQQIDYAKKVDTCIHTYRYKVCEYIQQSVKEKTIRDDNISHIHSILQENLMYS